MKKAALLVFAAMLVFMFCVPVMAMEYQFGGLWRTRFYTQQNFDGNDIEPDTGDWTAVDTRTRLFFTAVFHENLRFVNQFEFDGSWGRSTQGDLWRGRIEDIEPGDAGNEWSDIGADGANIEIKRSFVDFNVGPLFASVGIQFFGIGRGFVAAEDAPGLAVGYRGDGIEIPFIWIKAYEGGVSNNALDADYYGLRPRFTFDNFEIEPFVLYAYSDNARRYWDVDAGRTEDELGIFFAGLNADFDFNPVSLWLTGFYEGGDVDFTDGTSTDVSAWLGAIGGAFDYGMGDVHGQFFYATGPDDDEDIEQVLYLDTGLSSYYWAEIMGLGIFDTGYSVADGRIGDDISNVMAANLGFSVRPMDQLNVTFDAWWAQHAEDVLIGGQMEDELGVELDLVITYELVEGLNMDIVGAYLFAGDAIYNGPDDADPYEIGTRLQLTF
jgi:hypothetical protein